MQLATGSIAGKASSLQTSTFFLLVLPLRALPLYALNALRRRAESILSFQRGRGAFRRTYKGFLVRRWPSGYRDLSGNSDRGGSSEARSGGKDGWRDRQPEGEIEKERGTEGERRKEEEAARTEDSQHAANTTQGYKESWK